MATRPWRRLPILLVAVLLGGCIGRVRDTTTARTATEMLLISTAAERAIEEYDASQLSGKVVQIETKYFESVDQKFVLGSLRQHLAEAGALLIPAPEKTGDKPAAPGGGEPDKPGEPGEQGEGGGQAPAPPAPEVVLEIRNASLGIYDGDFVLGIPQLPVSAEGFPPVLLPPLYALRRFIQQGWAKLALWTYDPATRRYLDRSGNLWGTSYYTQWWILGIGPFDGSNDIYPEWDLDQYEAGSAEKKPPEED